jgi:beta-lactamase class D
MRRAKLSKFLLWAAISIISVICTENMKTFAAESKTPSRNEKNYFPQMKGCFLLYNMKEKTFDKVIGEENCRERFVACSTFKLPLAVMAFDSGVLKDENQTLKWDGRKGFLESHNHDHSAKTWIRDSVVWFSQRLTPQLGKQKIEKYLQDFHYGNEDFSGGLIDAWLVSPGDKSPALKISAYEQVNFMKNLWTDQLPTSKRAMQITRDISFLELSPHGFNLSGKTGSNFYDHNTDQDKRVGLGWFISHLEKGDQEYIAVANFSDLTPVDAKKYGGLRAKQIVKDILSDEGLW